MTNFPLRRRRLPCNFDKACNVLWLVRMMGFSQSQAAVIVGLNVGTVCHVIHGRRFPNAYPVPLPGM